MDLKLIIKSFIIGIGKIIPGVSGSLIAMTFGIYEDLINAITCFFSNPKKHIKLLLNFSIGLFGALIFFSKLILFCLNNYYYEVMYLFIGLILGTMITFTKQLKLTKKNILITFLFIIILVYFSNLNFKINYIFHSSLIHYLYIILLGIIDALSSIIPGISGTAIYMMLGVYEFVLNILSNPFSILFIIYGTGVVIGLILVCFLMHYLLKKHKKTTYNLIFIFMISSLIILLLKVISFINIYFILIFIVGIVCGYLFDK